MPEDDRTRKAGGELAGRPRPAMRHGPSRAALPSSHYFDCPSISSCYVPFMSQQPPDDDQQSPEAIRLLILNGGFDPLAMPEREALYRVNRDAEAEKEVALYVEAEGAEKVISAQKITSEQVFETTYTVWDVKTDQRRWWVISNPLNLYPQ